MEKRVRRRVGDILKIRISQNEFCFGRVLDEPIIAFYDLKSEKVLDIHEIMRHDILFKISVMNSAITSGRWNVVGNYPLEPELLEEPEFFMQDLDTLELSICKGGEERAATKEQCEGLEREAVWDPEHVEDRLRDHFAGRPNRWIDSLKIAETKEDVIF